MGGGGAGFIGGNASVCGARVVLWHEVNHGLGVAHANLWRADGSDPAGPGAWAEYGDSHDVQGGGAACSMACYRPNVPISKACAPATLSACLKWGLGYLHPDSIATVDPRNGTKVHSFLVWPHDRGASYGRTSLLRVPVTDKWAYFVSYRQHYAETCQALGIQCDHGFELHMSRHDTCTVGLVLDGTPSSVRGVVRNVTVSVRRRGAADSQPSALMLAHVGSTRIGWRWMQLSPSGERSVTSATAFTSQPWGCSRAQRCHQTQPPPRLTCMMGRCSAWPCACNSGIGPSSRRSSSKPAVRRPPRRHTQIHVRMPAQHSKARAKGSRRRAWRAQQPSVAWSP